MSVQMYTPPLTRVNKVIIASHVILFLLHSILANVAGFSLVGLLGLSSAGVNSGLIFQFVTFPFVESAFMSVLFNGLIIWFIGAELENKWGERFYIQFLLISAISAGLIYYVISLFVPVMSLIPLMGLTGFTYALLMAYGIIYSDRQLTFMLLFPMKAKYFCMLLAGIQLYMGIFSHGGKAAWAHLTSMAVAFLFLKYRSLKAKGASLSSWRQEQHKKKMRSKLSLVKNSEDEDSKKKADPKNPRYWQ